MYSAFWLFCVLSLACLLWWLRNPRIITGWLAWVAASVAMLGFHALGLVVLGIQLLIFLTHRRLHLRTAILFVMGAIVAISGIAIHATKFNRWTDRIEQQGWEATSGLSWIDYEIAGDSGSDLVEFSLVQQLFTGIRTEQRVDDPALAPWQHAVRYGVLLLPLLGLFPWPTRRRDRERPMEVGLRTTLWTLAWVVVPMYAFYCVSVRPFATPTEMLTAGWNLIPPVPLVPLSIVLVTAFYACDQTWRNRGVKIATFAVTLLVVYGLLEAVALVIGQRESTKPIWMTRYFGFVQPIILIAIAAMLNRLPGALAWVGVGLFTAANVPHLPGTLFDGHRPVAIQQFAVDVAAAQPERGTQTRTYTLPPRSGAFMAGTSFYGVDARYYLFWATGRQTYPDEFRNSNPAELFTLRNQFTPDMIAADVATVPAVQRLIIWRDVRATRLGSTQNDEAPAISGFTLVHSERFKVNVVSDARSDGTDWLRHEYERQK